jgi:SAM-dependent methyltransferase
MDRGYRELMRRWYDYTASDFDQSAHRADIRIDLQDITLPDQSIDVLLTPHVLEHVPDTARALGEIHRVLAPGGRMYLQVPMLIGTTTVPTTPEFHGDNTPVFFNFGWDLVDRLRDTGFTTTVLVTDAYRDILSGIAPTPEPNGDGFDIPDLVARARPSDLIGVADDQLARVYGFLPAYHYSTFECVKAG